MSLQQPNILLFQFDQLTASRLSCYGNTIAHTPNISSLADNGLVFERAYSNFPLCAPSRFSMLAGQLASNIDVFDNGSEFKSSVPTINHYLRAAGYQTCLAGKMHFVGADQLHGYQTRLTTDIYPADFGWTGDWTEVTQAHSNDLRSFTKAGVCLRNPQMEYDEEVTHRTRRKLFDLSRTPDPDPFFITVSYTHPHDPYQCLQEHWDLYQHQSIDMPKVSSVLAQQDDPYSQRLRTQYGLNNDGPTEDLVRIARHAYYGSLSYADEQLGKVLETLRQTGLDQNTVIVITSDHGDMLGERGLWYKKSFFEDSVRIPLIISGVNIRQQRIRTPVSLVDLAPTFTALAQPADRENPSARLAPLVENLEGSDLLQINPEDQDRVVYSENLAEGAMCPIVMVCGKRYKYNVSKLDGEQFFDLEQDPLELENIIDDAKHGDGLNHFRQKASEKWDLETLHERVINSQNGRLFIRDVLGNQPRVSWDYQPEDQATKQCLRADRTYNEWAYNDVIGLKTSPK